MYNFETIVSLSEESRLKLQSENDIELCCPIISFKLNL